MVDGRPVAAAENRRGLPARGPKWILQQAPAHFTLQLLAARQAHTIRQFLAAHRDLSAEMAYFQVTDRGRPWRVLIYGAFATKSAARKAAQDLASRSKGTRTWIRAYKHIQEEIRAGTR